MLKLSEIQSTAKNTLVNALGLSHKDDGSMVQFGNYEYAVPVVVDGQTVWAKVEVTCGQIADTKTNVAFNPMDKRDEWLADIAEKTAEREKEKAEKAARLAKKKAIKEKAKAKKTETAE